jgi:hypothetical protein
MYVAVDLFFITWSRTYEQLFRVQIVFKSAEAFNLKITSLLMYYTRIIPNI